jgi:hypothetical protein
MTIKRNGEKVILKGGKVSCSCCEEPEECCMYPAQALVDGGYTVDDLPDEVLYNDDDRPPTLIQKVPDGSFPGGVVYRWPEDGSDDAGLIFIRINADVETSIWEFGDDAGEGGSLCLIQGDGNLTPGDDLVEDQFADTYTVDIASGALVVQVERFAVYGWISEVIQEGDNYFCIILAYCEYGGPSYGFGLTKSNNFDNQTDASAQRQSYIDKLIYVFQTGLNPKIGFNNTPEGSYPWFSTTATVS